MKFEYRIERLNGPFDGIVKRLNELGADGWKLIENIHQDNEDHFVFCLMRQVE